MSDSKAQSPTPPLHAEVRAAIEKVVFDNTICLLEHKKGGYGNGQTDGITLRDPECVDAILQAVADALLAGLPEKMTNTKEEENNDWFYGYGYNAALDVVTRVIGELRGSNNE